MTGSWGGYPRAPQHELVAVRDRSATLPVFRGLALAYGNGRSYGDSCLNPGGTLLLTRGMDRYIALDVENGTLDCESGVLLSEIQRLVVPRGWCLPVMPGTLQVTVGGAIANDVHGKNHARMGSFGDHVVEFELLRSDGSRRLCRQDVERDWFRATVGGLGLTGLITRAVLRLRPIRGATLDACVQRFGNLAGFFSLAGEHARREYSVAWVDSLAGGKSLGRGVFMAADHAAGTGPPSQRALAVPVTPPFSLVNPMSLRAFNALYYRRGPLRPSRRQLSLPSFFQPLDRIAHWNRMYGPHGFLQHQCVIPPAQAEPAIAELLDRIAASKTGSFLVVLKQFGERHGPGLLSFCRPGTTLAMDFPFRGRRTLDLLDQLDRIVVAAGGAIYPAKDARMSPSTFAASFPRLAEFDGYRDPRFSSGLWRRVMGEA
ncbi:FAD-binding oxidoreductase [Luteimonas saliphila]|uniref:FAD-binding oxidoreductase n=1 Tax=Luteimonas saliphila TaxID=2804919 RepID=UPI00192E1A79|nr:FAD-binding oxidoreductase [Luteimonas saliphila]